MVSVATEPVVASSPKVSWLLPVYNGEQFLREALDSIRSQTFTDFEIIVVNDGSTDATRRILAEYERTEPRLRVLDKANGGIVSALNAGLEISRGEYIARLDADDVALPDRLRLQVEYLDANPGCVLVGGYAVTRKEGVEEWLRTTGGRHRHTDLQVFPPRVAVAMHPLVCLRREALAGIGGYSPDYPHAEDYDLFIRLSDWGTIDNPPFDVLIYRRHEGAISIRNVELQERSAAEAERDACARKGRAQVPERIFDPYVRLRIFRRYASLDAARARELAPALLRALLRIDPRVVWDRRDLRLRAIIAANLLRYGRRRLRHRGC